MLIADLKLILKIAELNSISAAAVSLDMQAATASAALKRVEAELGVELFVRTTRHLRLSNAGERFLPQCQESINLLSIAKQNIKADNKDIEGELRVALSSDLGRNIVIPWLDELLDSYPNLSLRSHISDSNIDFYRDAVDLALRYGKPNNTNLYGFKICNIPKLLCATPEYLSQNGEPTKPSDLQAHQGLFYQLQDRINDTWEFLDNDKVIKVKMKGRRAANDGDLVRRWCIKGKGLAVKSAIDIADDLIEGRAVTLMPKFPHKSTELWLICPSRQSITPAVRLVRDECRKRTKALLQKLIDKGILTKSVLD